MKTLASAMRSAGLDVKLVKQEFYEGAPDVEWLPKAIANGWILFAKDDRWRYRAAEKQIIVDAKAKAFVFVSKTAKAHEVAETIVKNIHKIANIIASTPPPFIAHILLSGHVYIVYPENQRGS